MHLLLQRDHVLGWEYGMLLSLEDEIVRQTGAERFLVRYSRRQAYWHRRLPPGTRYSPLRQWVPRGKLDLPPGTDVAWHVLMGPENYSLDLRSGWHAQARHRLVYFFDTLPEQMESFRQSFSGREWDILVTSFNDAIPMLERETGRKWHHVDQAVTLGSFPSAPYAERVIHFSAYGRRHPKVHEAAIRFCAERSLYYDYTTHGRSDATAPPPQLLKQFAWHMSHSLFTFCWPVEVTNPGRAGDLSPITCRWFEAAAAGAVVIGQAPRNPHFREVFGDDFVVPLDLKADADGIIDQLDAIWQRREEMSARAHALRERLGVRLDWSSRVRQMLDLVEQAEGRA